jgi:sugar phosphate isomerase/epimerase
MSDRLGVNFITLLGMPPLESLALVAQLGVHDISMGLAPFTANPHGYPAWSLRDDPALRREFMTAMKAHEMTISVGEYFLIREGSDMQDAAADIALFAEIGAKRVNALSIDPDVSRTIDQLGIFAELAAVAGMDATLEYMAGTAVGTLGKALAVIEAVGQPNLTLLLDCLHFARSGGRPADLAAVDPALIGYLQLCDAPDKPLDKDYGDDARDNRLPPGDGALPLAEILKAAPANIPIGLEIPMRAKAEAGLPPRDYVGDAVIKARALLANMET